MLAAVATPAVVLRKLRRVLVLRWVDATVVLTKKQKGREVIAAQTDVANMGMAHHTPLKSIAGT